MYKRQVFVVSFQSSRGLYPGDIILKALDIITIVIPPALPATMTIGKLYALGRLKKYKISCINSRVINVSGSIDCVCFDKVLYVMNVKYVCYVKFQFYVGRSVCYKHLNILIQVII